MEGRVLRRSVTLADQLAAVGPAPSVAVAGSGGAAAGSCNLRDLLKLRDEDDLASAGRRAAVTLASAMAAERQVSAPSPSLSPSPSSSAAAAAAARTLLDIIRDDQPPASGPAAGAGAVDPLVRRAVSLPPPTTATASPPAPALAAAEAAPAPPPPPAVAAADEEEEEQEQEQRVSLMALLEQTDRQWSAVPGGAAQPEPEEEDSATLEALEPAEPEAAGRGVVAGCCCVCMARAKGAAFIPCGHTFCRGCARELLAGRGRCPLCNAAIVDVLDIF